MGVFAPIRDYVATLVHPSVFGDALAAARHRAFIAPRLIGGIAAIASFPLYLIARGTPSGIELLVFAWLVAPILTAYFLSRTGRYESAHVLSSLALTGLVTVVAAATGGIDSFAAIWLVVVPLEASLSASRRVVATASTLALAAAGLLVLLGTAHLLPTPVAGGQAALAALGIVSAALYATGLALGAEALARTSFWLLYAEEDRYRLLARTMTDVITRHGRDGAVVFMSPAGETLFGVPVGVLHGHGLFERVHVADRPAYLTALGDAAALAESRSVEFRVRRECADDEGVNAAQFVWIEMRCRPLERAPADAGVTDRREVVAVLRDVSRRKQHEQALEEARVEAERANASKTRFLATMSHELRTPLNAIIGFSEMLMKEQVLVLDPKRRGEYASLIRDSGHHLLSVVNGILDMSKIETDNFEITAEPFAPAQVVAGCCELVALRAREAGIRLEKSVDDDLPEMIADRRALNQILLNLLSNAVRFSDRGGKVVIGARSEAGAIIFTVDDDGIGMSEEDLAQVGQPYFQARASYDRRRGGTGLGLSIVKGLVRLHGGQLSIRSRIGEGTRVAVRLPLDCEQVRRMQQSSASEQAGVAPATNNIVVPAVHHGAARLPDPFADRDSPPLSRDIKILVKKSA
ncbi:MAG TPA: PAS domain-containing sensor histidine kinase [Xanthobacteraceae bacterium]|nr:PAS domain-containing sensor histidine kinase [Xanthobacteraceae bacterium]